MSNGDDGRIDLSASDSDIERALDELEDLIPPRHSAVAGHVIDGRYRIIDELGRGGFGRVFEVRHIHLRRTFALKLLHPQIAEDPGFITRFQEEARATSVIGHDNIVFVTDFGECPEHGHYLVMEYLVGERLSDILRNRAPISIRETLDCVVAVGSALAATHSLGIVHCDLKPANIMFGARDGAQEVWKVLDFGTSSLVNEAVKTGSTFGTPRFMAPEQADGRDVDARADIFSLGVVVYQMLAGQLPWTDKSWAAARSASRSANPPPPLDEVGPGVSKAVGDVVMKALSVDPADRWEDAETFVAYFRDAADVTYIPVADSLDSVSEVSAGRGFKHSKTAPVVSKVHRAASLVIERPDTELSWRMVFRTADRLRREYRRNMVARGLFVTAEGGLPPRDSTVTVTIAFRPTKAELRLQGRVVSHSHGNPAGFGIEISYETQAALEAFLDEHGITRSLSNRTRLRAVSEIPARSWTPAEAFVLSIASDGVSVAELRARSTGLPFDVEMAVFKLSDAGLLEIQEAETQTTKPERFRRRQPTQQQFKIVYDDEEIAQVLELAEQFRDRGNYLAAKEVLERSLSLAADRSPFERGLKGLQADFLGNPDSSPSVMSRSFHLQNLSGGREDTRVRLRRILGTDPLDD